MYGGGVVSARWRPWTAAILVMGLSMVLGCDGDDYSSTDEPYRIGAMELNGDGEFHEWAPGDEHVSRWFDEALGDSDRGVSSSAEGMEMDLSVHHEVRLVELEHGARLEVDVEAQATRSVVSSSSPMVTLSAEANYQHPLARGRPSEQVLHALSRTMGHQAVGDVVEQLRLRARIRQSSSAEVAELIADKRADEEERLYAIEHVVQTKTKSAVPGLEQAVEDQNLDVSTAAARALYALEADSAAHGLMHVAQRLSRDKEYDRYLQLLPLLSQLDAPWVSIYLETVAKAHQAPRIRERVRSVMDPQVAR